MKAGRIVTLLLVLALLVTLGGCSAPEKKDSADSAASSAAGSQVVVHTDPYTDVTGKKVGISMPAQTDQIAVRQCKVMEDMFRRRGCEVTTVYADGTAGQQATDLGGLISSGCDLLLIKAVDGSALTKVLKKAHAKDIPVIACGQLITGNDAVSYYVAEDSYRIGTMQGKYLIDTLGMKLDVNSKEYHVEFAAGDPNDYKARYRFNGAYDVLKPYIDAGILIIGSGQSTFAAVATPGYDSAAAEERLKQITNQYYTDGKILDGIICGNDTIAEGAAKAVESGYNGKNHVLIIGQGGDLKGLSAVLNRKASMTTYIPCEDEATVAAALGLVLLSGDPGDGNLIRDNAWDFSCTFDTSSYDNGTGILPAYLLTPVVITESSLKAELIDKGHFTLDGNTLQETA